MILLINVYNRAETVRKSLSSLVSSELPDNLKIILIDDGSFEPELFKFYKTLNNDNVQVKMFPHQGLPDGKVGRYWEFLANYEESYFFISDSDMIYAKKWMQALEKIYEKLKSEGKRPALITGFDTHDNEHKPIKYEDYYSVKESVGGANLLVDIEFYKTYRFGNPKFCGQRQAWEWDWSMSDNAVNNGWLIASTLKSVVQHTGHKGAWSKENEFDSGRNFIGEKKNALIELNL